MNDGIILGTGNSRWMKSAIPEDITHEELVALLRAGTFPFDLNGINEAGWRQLGQALNKASLLTDATETALFGSAENRTVNEALYQIYQTMQLIKGDVAELTVTVTDSTGLAVKNVIVSGMATADGNAVYTDSNGVATGYVSEGTATISISGYADLAGASMTFDVDKGTVLEKTLTAVRRNFLKLTTSQSVRFSGNVTKVGVTAVGGGGGGASGDSCREDNTTYYGGGGGGGGYCTVNADVAFAANAWYAAVIGAGGAGGPRDESSSSRYGRDGGDGGSTSFMGVTAAGGSGGIRGDTPTGGAGNGKGGTGGSKSASGGNGTAGAVYGYDSYTSTVRYGGGGGGGKTPPSSHTAGTGGAGYGGAGGTSSIDAPAAPEAGTGGGGGGGYAADSYNAGPGADGASGCVAIRMTIA